MKNGLLVIAGLAMLGGCADRTPLIFVSKTSVGVEVSAPGTGTGEFGASIGVNTLDAAYVPVVERAKSGSTVYLVESGESSTDEVKLQVVDALSRKIDEGTKNIATFSTNWVNATTTEAKQQARAELDKTREEVQADSEKLANVISRNDALSVFSTFDSNTILRAESAGQGVGKVFATGLAAQNVSRSFNQQALALATCKAKVAPTVATLAAASDQPSKDLAIKLLEGCK